jgi:hypothetical protein
VAQSGVLDVAMMNNLFVYAANAHVREEQDRLREIAKSAKPKEEADAGSSLSLLFESGQDDKKASESSKDEKDKPKLETKTQQEAKKDDVRTYFLALATLRLG